MVGQGPCPWAALTCEVDLTCLVAFHKALALKTLNFPQGFRQIREALM